MASLCSHLPKAEKSDWWALYSPYLVRSDGPGLRTEIKLFAHPVAAFLEFYAQAVAAMSAGQLFESDISCDAAGFPVLRLISTREKEWSDPSSGSRITFQAVMQPHIDPVTPQA
ncbi:hypothetical protein [Paraburkholderia sp. SIMBA_030]|uniref:hypothetical protein n=1 Tax=Paraburkholderia sp. SIMBA_030 TaxID=3085773 RepID=UPI00397BE0C3